MITVRRVFMTAIFGLISTRFLMLVTTTVIAQVMYWLQLML
eukprot:SAG11_NODE_293_length_11144_cov_4.661928_9_plen_41_part_00